MNRLYITKEEDRLAVAAILVKNKYMVWQGSERRGNSRSYDYFLEYGQIPGKAPGKKEDEGEG